MDDQVPTSESSPPQAANDGRRNRSILAGVALVLACLTIVIATTAIWIHQVALKTDRFVALATEIIDEPALIDPIAARVSEQVVTALDVEARIAQRLPGESAALARPITAAVQGALDRQLQKALSNPRVQEGLVNTLAFGHERVVAFLRGETEGLTISDGYLYLNVFPVVGAALVELQAIGLIPPETQLPDLSSDEVPAALADRLETSLGLTLPPDFGTVQLMKAERLSTAQTLVKVFDLLVIVLIVLSLVLAVLAVWLARERRRMVIFLAIGTILAFLAARFAVRGVASSVVDSVADEGLAGALGAVVYATVEDLVGLTTIVLIGTAILLAAVYLAGRPAWLMRLVKPGSTDAEPGTGSPDAT